MNVTWFGSSRRWNPRIVTMKTLPSLAAPEVVVMTTPGAASDDKVGIMVVLKFQYLTLYTQTCACISIWPHTYTRITPQCTHSRNYTCNFPRNMDRKLLTDQSTHGNIHMQAKIYSIHETGLKRVLLWRYSVLIIAMKIIHIYHYIMW